MSSAKRWWWMPMILGALLGGCAPTDAAEAGSAAEASSASVESVARAFGDPTRLDPDSSDAPAARYPIVLMHGFNASADEERGLSFYRVASALKNEAPSVTLLDVPPYNSVEERTNVAKQQIIAILDGYAKTHRDAPKVNIIAHSMGGLDARAIASDPWFRGKIATVTTIATPHRGTRLAEWALNFLPAADGVGAGVLSQLSEWWAHATFSPMERRTNMIRALQALQVGRAPAFDRAHPDAPGVFYQSFAGVSEASPPTNPSEALKIGKDYVRACGVVLGDPNAGIDELDASLKPLASHVVDDARSGAAAADKRNDGLVAVASAKGPAASAPGRWHFRGCIRGDHLDVIGQPKHTTPALLTGFDHLRFYRNLAHDIARINEAQAAEEARR